MKYSAYSSTSTVSRFPRYISRYIAENVLPLGQCMPGFCAIYMHIVLYI